MTENSQQVSDTRDAINAIGVTLRAFLKSGPQYPTHIQDAYADISEAVHSLIPSSQAATASYERACKSFLDNVIEVRGMPTRPILVSGGDDTDVRNVSFSGSHITQIFDELLPSITERYKWCVENYRFQAGSYLNDQKDQFQVMLKAFLCQVPTGGTKDKAINGCISEIIKEIRHLAKWKRLFYTYKAMSFPAEIECVFMLAGNPIAAIWCYSNLDAQGEYQKTYDHEQRNRHVYAVRGNWAIKKGLMQVGPDGYLDEIGIPGREIGCMCSLQWVTGIRRLPGNMITEKGCAKLSRVTAAIQAESQPEKKPQSVVSTVEPSLLKRWLLGWFGFRRR